VELTRFKKRQAHTWRGTAGFSMIEALIAAAILLIIALGLIPLFSRAITDNTNGNDATQATNGSRTQIEDLLQMPFNNLRLTVPAGNTQSQAVDSWAQGDKDKVGDPNEGWWSTPTGKGTVLWTRTTRVRQYSINGLVEQGHLGTPLPGGTQPTFIQLKEIEVVIGNPKQGLLGSGQGITLRMIRPF
jgi:type II secretory pathway pseudopilin PulG